MRELGIRSIIRRKRKYYGNETKIIKPNILEQNFRAEKSNIKWSTDITNLYYKNIRFYLCVILDLYNREILSYMMSNRNDNQLVINTIKQASENAEGIPGVILHSDQGSQYTTEYYSNMLLSKGIVQSMSRRGNCLDNAPVECFFSHLKSELIYTTKFSSEEEMKRSIVEYIRFYNQERIQQKLNNLAPVSYKITESMQKMSH
jgi:putative transposase